MTKKDAHVGNELLGIAKKDAHVGNELLGIAKKDAHVGNELLGNAKKDAYVGNGLLGNAKKDARVGDGLLGNTKKDAHGALWLLFQSPDLPISRSNAPKDAPVEVMSLLECKQGRSRAAPKVAEISARYARTHSNPPAPAGHGKQAATYAAAL